MIFFCFHFSKQTAGKIGMILVQNGVMNMIDGTLIKDTCFGREL